MLDVHPPHEAAHTWKDFFIHIATIVVGLLIAVGLEQTVERLHNTHLRHELQEQLRDQSVGNQLYIAEDVRIAEAYYDWAQVQAAALRNSSGPVKLARMPKGEVLVPDTGVWLASKDSGRTALLPVEEQVLYSDLQRVEQRSFAPGIGSWDRMSAALSSLDATLLQHVKSTGGSVVPVGPMSPEDRASCSRAFDSVQAAARDFDHDLIMYDSYNNFVHGTNPDKWFDDVVNNTWTTDRLKAYAAHPRSQYSFSAR